MPPERIFPRLGRPRVLVANRQCLTSAMALLSQTTQVSEGILQIVKQLSPLLFFALTRQVRESESEIFDHTHAQEALRDIFHLPTENINYYIGTFGPRQKFTAQVNHEGKVIAYAKMGSLPEAKRLLNNEKKILSALQKFGFDQNRFAPLIGHHSTDDWEIIVTSSPSHELRQRPIKLDAQDIEFTQMLFALTQQSMNFRQYDAGLTLSNRITAICQFPQLQFVKSRLVHSLETLSRYMEGRDIQTGFCHGDFTPWNTLRQRDGQQYAFDWEYGTLHGPALADLFHFVRSIQHHIHRHNPIRITASILDGKVGDSQYIYEYAKALRIDHELVPVYFQLYLFQEILRHAEIQSAIQPALAQYPSQITQINFLTTCLSSTLDFLKGGPRRRVLVAAYACESDKGSEPGVGWNWVQEISKDNEVWVITKKNNKESISLGMEQAPNQHLHFEYVDLPRWISFWKKKQRGVRTYYYLWQFAALYRGYVLNKRIAFDVAHHVTFVNDWLWSFLALLPIPYVWGPIGSHPPYPHKLSPDKHILLSEAVRLMIQRTFRLVDPLYWITAIRASKIIAINHQCAQQSPLSLLAKSKFIISPAIAVERQDKPGTVKDHSRFRVLFVGRFHYTKCPNLVIEAFSHLSKEMEDCELIMVGRGPAENKLRKLAADLSLEDKVDFKPWQSRSEILRLMQKCDIFIFPSVEGGGMVILEAMAAGLPIICLDYGGPGTMVTTEVGIKVPIRDRSQVICSLSQAMHTLAHNPEFRERLSLSSRERAQTIYSWGAKGHLASTAYNQILNPQLSKDLNGVVPPK